MVGLSKQNKTMSTFQIIVLLIIVWIAFSQYNKYNKKQKLKEKEEADKKKFEQLKSDKVKDQLGKVQIFEQQVEEIKKITIPEISEYKSTVISSESEIVKRGGDSQLFTFLKVDTFLKDFKDKIENDQDYFSNTVSPESLRIKIQKVDTRSSLEKLEETAAIFEAYSQGDFGVTFEYKLENLVKSAHSIKPMINNEILTLEYYKSIATAMVIFYLNEKKIRYFEIYEAFEKLGVFDSTWQKNVLGKLDSIDERLATMNNGLLELNRNFVSLTESSNNIVKELQEINSGVAMGNLLQGITAYQTWRVNKKLVN